MAGGPLAERVTCMVCLTEGNLSPAKRTYDGDESDDYRCERGHEFGMDWSSGPAPEPQWPPSPELTAFARQASTPNTSVPPEDPVERGEYERQREQFEQTRNIPPSKLVK